MTHRHDLNKVGVFSEQLSILGCVGNAQVAEAHFVVTDEFVGGKPPAPLRHVARLVDIALTAHGYFK